MLTKAEEARIANDKARINDLVSTEVLASYGKDGQLDKEQLLKNLKRIPGVDGLPDTAEEMEFDETHPLEFTVDGYKVTVEWTGKVTVGDSTGGESTPTPSETPLTGINLSAQSLEVEEGKTVELTATKVPENADDELTYTVEPSEARITVEETGETGSTITLTITGESAGSATITVSGTKNSEKKAQCIVTVKKVEVAEFNPEELTFDPNGEALHAECYGTEVKLKKSEETPLANGPWKLFYQDVDYTYIIRDEFVRLGYLLMEYGSRYDTGEVGAIGKALSPQIWKEKPKLFTLDGGNANMKGVAYLTNEEEWKTYADGLDGALFSIGSPTIELFRASFNAAQGKGKCGSSGAIEDFTMDSFGYQIPDPESFLVGRYGFDPCWCNGIYIAVVGEINFNWWWLASPSIDYADGVCCLDVNGGNALGYFGTLCTRDDWGSIRPLVCFRTSEFDKLYNAGY